MMEGCRDVLKIERQIRKTKADRGVSIVRSRSLWSFNRYIVSRDLWKALYVPAITYGNAVLVFGSEFEKLMEAKQRIVARYAMGCRYGCSNEFVVGDSGMSSFLERESVSKIKYFLRLKQVDKEKFWAAKLQEVKEEMGIKTKWDRRVQFVIRKAGWNRVVWDEESVENGKNKVKERVSEYENERWRRSMSEKVSLQMYREGKRDRGAEEGLYDNSVGSGLLADARAGMLDTMELRSKYMDVSDICRLCNEKREDIRHIILECRELGDRNINLQTGLGIGEPRNGEEIKRTKKRLGKWRKMVRDKEVGDK